MANTQPIYTPFFGSMGATAAIAFSGKIINDDDWSPLLLGLAGYIG